MKLLTLAFLAAAVAMSLAGLVAAQPACDYLLLPCYDPTQPCYTPTLNQTVEQGTVASYPIWVNNVASDPQAISLSAECNPAATGLVCDFADVPYPNVLYAGETRIYHLNVDTSNAKASNYELGLNVGGGTIPGSCVSEGSVLLTVTQKPPSAVVTLGVGASLAQSGLTARPGETVEWIILVSNNRADEAYVSLSATDNPFSKGIGFDAIEMRLAPGEQRAIKARVILPAGTPGGMYNWLFVAKVTTFNGIDSIELPASLRVAGPTIAVQLIGEPIAGTCLGVRHRETGELKMNVKNTGDAKVTLSFGFEAGRETKGTISIKPALLELLPGETSGVTITVTPPSTAVVDTYRYVFTAENNGFQLLRRPYCYSLKGLEEVYIGAPKSVEVLRTIPEDFLMVVKNTGTTSDDYALEFVPLPGVETTMSPMSFSLGPSDSKSVKATLKTKMSTELREEPLSLTLRSRAANLSKAIAVNVSIVSSNQTNASLLALDARSLSAVEDVSTTNDVVVRNLDSDTMNGVSLAVTGIPSDWYSVLPTQQNIAAQGSASFKLTIKASTPGVYNVSLAAFAGREGVAVTSTLSVDKAAPAINARVFATQAVEQEGVVKGVVVNFSVSNTGNTPLTGVEPRLTNVSGDFAFSTVATDLAPGETKTVSMVVKPLGASTPLQNLPVQVASREALSTPQTITLPAMAREKYVAGISLATMAAVVVLLVLLGALVFLAWRARQVEY
jgi:uncharacterized membrane protein